MKYFNQIRFVLRLLDREIVLGKLDWPFTFRELVVQDKYVEIVERNTSSVISLSDITLGDLYD
jgi:hypothetical protein